ncbi:MAG: thioredoxin domain-containing protein [Desulfobacteraceae bacterium]
MVPAQSCHRYNALTAPTKQRQNTRSKERTPPLDLAVSRDGQWVYLLLKDGTLQAYTYDGSFRGAIEVGTAYDQIEAGPREDEIYLLGRNNKTVRIIELVPDQQIDTSGSPYKGAADAPIVITEFTDFQCPYCAQLVGTLTRLLDLYPGKIKIVYKSYPLNNHRYAWKAAAAAMAAHLKGRFWKFHDRLFEHYKTLNDKVIDDIRKEFGFDTPEFDTLMRSTEVRTQVARDRTEGQRIGVRGTPTVFINGKRLKDKSFEGFRKAIDRELKTASQ